jgi:nucleotide-binding universal stress UspA family protein
MYKKIMVPLDGSKLAECVLPHVDGFVTGSQVETIIFVRVIEPTPNRYSAVGSTVGPENYETVRKNVERIEEESRSSAERYLKEVISRVKQDGIKYKVDVLVGKVWFLSQPTGVPVSAAGCGEALPIRFCGLHALRY